MKQHFPLFAVHKEAVRFMLYQVDLATLLPLQIPHFQAGQIQTVSRLSSRLQCLILMLKMFRLLSCTRCMVDPVCDGVGWSGRTPSDARWEEREQTEQCRRLWSKKSSLFFFVLGYRRRTGWCWRCVIRRQWPSHARLTL